VQVFLDESPFFRGFAPQPGPKPKDKEGLRPSTRAKKPKDNEGLRPSTRAKTKR